MLQTSDHGIRIYFFQIQLFFSMRIRIQQLFKCGSGSSLTKFETNYLMKSWNRKKIAQNLKNNGACPIYLTFYNKITISTNFLAFFNFFPQILPLLDPDPLIECGSGKLNLCPYRHYYYWVDKRYFCYSPGPPPPLLINSRRSVRPCNKQQVKRKIWRSNDDYQRSEVFLLVRGLLR